MESNAFDSLLNTIVFDPRDWSLNPKDLWIYGIIVGWEDECFGEFEKRFNWWEKEDTERLKLMHETFVKCAKENNAKYYKD